MSNPVPRIAYTPDPVGSAMRGKCPRCGQGKLFSGYLSLSTSCEVCNLDFEFADSGDGPAFFVMTIVSFIVVAAALAVEVAYRPPYWVHAALWLPLLLGLSLGLLRPLKGLMIGQQYRVAAHEGRLARDTD